MSRRTPGTAQAIAASAAALPTIAASRAGSGQEANHSTSAPVAAGLTVGAEALELGADLEDAQETAALRELAGDLEHNAEAAWDSAERREAHVAGIQPGKGQPVAATAWKQADLDNARHPREAVRSGKTRSSKSRVPSTTPGKQIERDGR